MAPFDDYLATHTPPGTQYREPDDPLQNPYTIHSGQPGVPVWEIMSRTPSRLRTFQLGMAGIDVAIPATGHFDFGAALRDTNTDTDTPEEDDNGTAVQLVDVGGGTGGTLRKILDAYPDDIKPGRVVLQDRKEVVELARRGGMLPEGVRIMEGDFMGVQTIRSEFYFFLGEGKRGLFTSSPPPPPPFFPPSNSRLMMTGRLGAGRCLS